MIEWTSITEEVAFDRLVLAASLRVVVAFEARNCSHCREQRSLLALVWRHLGWNAPTVRVDAARLPRIAMRYQIVGYPTLAVFTAGQLVERYPGRRSAADLTRRLASILATPDGPLAAHRAAACADSSAPTTPDPLPAGSRRPSRGHRCQRHQRRNAQQT